MTNMNPVCTCGHHRVHHAPRAGCDNCACERFTGDMPEEDDAVLRAGDTMQISLAFLEHWANEHVGGLVRTERVRVERVVREPDGNVLLHLSRLEPRRG